MRISDWSSDVCSSDLAEPEHQSGGRIFQNRPIAVAAQHATVFFAGQLHQGAAQYSATDESGPFFSLSAGCFQLPPKLARVPENTLDRSVRGSGNTARLSRIGRRRTGTARRCPLHTPAGGHARAEKDHYSGDSAGERLPYR